MSEAISGNHILPALNLLKGKRKFLNQINWLKSQEEKNIGIENEPGYKSDEERQAAEQFNQQKRESTEGATQEEIERAKNFQRADYAREFFAGMLKDRNSYSETFRIKDDGRFDKVERLDGSPVYMGEADTPEELYRIAKDIQEKYSEYQFSFETGPGGEWMKYTVSRKQIH